MIDIRVNNHSLDLGKVSINFELKSPLFNDEGSFSYPFTIPTTAWNKELLGFPFSLHGNMSQQTVIADILLNGILWKRGSLIITEADADNIKMFITIAEGDIRNKLKTTRLNQIDLGGQRQVADYKGIGENDVFSKAYESIYPDEDFAIFPIFNRAFYDDTDYKVPFEEIGYVNIYDKFNKMNITNNTFVPFVYLNYLIERIFAHFGTRVQYNHFTTHPELLQLVVYNNVAINSFFQEDETNFNILLNPTFDLKNHVPDISVHDFFELIAKTFGIFLFINEFDDNISLLLFDQLLTTHEVPVLEVPLKFLTLSQNEYKGYSVEMQKDSSDDIYNTFYASNIKSVDISNYNFKGNIDLITHAQLIENDCYFAENVKRYYAALFSYQPNGSYSLWWKDVSQSYADFIIGIGNISFTPQASLIENFARQKGNFDNNPGDFNKFDLRLLFFRSWTETSHPTGSYLSPYGTAYSSRINIDIDEYGLYWHGYAGLYERFWKHVIEFYKRTRVGEFRMLLSPSQLKQIDLSKKYRFANATWLISEIKFQVTNDAISPSEVVAFSV